MAPLPFQQLTRLQLRGSSYRVAEVLTMISELAELEILEVLETVRAFMLLAFDAAALSELPKLRLVNLSGSLLWEDQHYSRVTGDAKREYLPLPVVRQLMSLQRAHPNIEWDLGNHRHWRRR